jgi:hypothetical protein
VQSFGRVAYGTATFQGNLRVDSLGAEIRTRDFLNMTQANYCSATYDGKPEATHTSPQCTSKRVSCTNNYHPSNSLGTINSV